MALTSERDFIRWIAAEFKRMDVGGETPINGSDAVEWMNDTAEALRAAFPDLAGPRGIALADLGAIAHAEDGRAYWLAGDRLMAAPLNDDGSVDAGGDIPVREFEPPRTDVEIAALVTAILAARAAAEADPEPEVAPTLAEAAAAVLDAVQSGDLNAMTTEGTDALDDLAEALYAEQSRRTA